MASAIRDEASVTLDVADTVIDFLAVTVAPTGKHHLKGATQLEVIHPVLEKVMPDDTPAPHSPQVFIVG